MVPRPGDPAAGIVALYERHARSYDQDRSRALFERPWLDRFVAAMAPGGTVLDLGCGSGEPIARHLIERGLAVTGVDSAPTLVGLCRRRFPRAEWIVADMRRLDLGCRFAGILAWDSFFHLSPDDQRGMLAVFAAHAAPGTALMLTTGPAAGEAIGSYRGEPLYHASLDREEYRALFAGAGFCVLRHVEDDAGCGGHTVWLARFTSCPDQPDTPPDDHHPEGLARQGSGP
jgi:SAM-dependent methyltransferase